MERNNMFTNYDPLECKNCGVDVLNNISQSIVVIDEQDNKVKDVYACCKGKCDDELGRPSGWKELKDFTNPYLYLKHIMAILNNVYEGMEFTEEGLEGYKQVLLRTAPYVFRNLNDDEIDRAITSNMLPF